MSNQYSAIYEQQSKDFMSPRELEASVLSKAAMKLKSCQEKWNSTEREKMLDEAIRYNQKVWSFFQSELSMPDNPLPKNMREDILNLSLFIDKRLFEVMAYPHDPAKLDIVININLNLAAGLRTTPSGP
ncbi:MAG: flagellar biosynthesis regulator FlaF [Geobacter sp.]|nr:flagellar biosynthesis regulator FlaF [Geobacter sp.]